MLLRTALTAYTAHKMAEANANPNAPGPYFTPEDALVAYPGRLTRRALRREILYGPPAPYYAPQQQPQVVYQVQPQAQQGYYPPQQSYPPGSMYYDQPQANLSYSEQRRGLQQGSNDSQWPLGIGRDRYDDSKTRCLSEPPTYESSTLNRRPLVPLTERDEKRELGAGSQVTRK